jgi:predicted dehydrogenase
LEEKIKVAVIGLGSMGRFHVRTYSQIPEAELMAVSDPIEAIGKEVSSKHKVHYYPDYHEMLEREDIDLVSIVVPNYLHAPVAMDVIKAGKNVAIEKPLCLSLKDADALIDSARERGVLAMYCENLVFAPSYDLAKQIVDSGAIGRVHMVRGHESAYWEDKTDHWSSDVKQSGGGVIIEVGIHMCAYLIHLLNREKAVRVYAEANKKIFHPYKEGDYEDIALITIRFERGELAWIDTSTHSAGGFNDRVEIYGDGIIFTEYYGAMRVFSQTGYPYQRLWGDWHSQGWSYPLADQERAHGYWHELRHMVECVKAGHNPRVTLEDGRAALELVLAAYRSAAKGTPVDLPLSE